MIQITFLLLKVEINKLVLQMSKPIISELTSSSSSSTKMSDAAPSRLKVKNYDEDKGRNENDDDIFGFDDSFTTNEELDNNCNSLKEDCKTEVDKVCEKKVGNKQCQEASTKKKEQQCMTVDEQMYSSSRGMMADSLVEDREESLVVDEKQVRADCGDRNEMNSEADTFLRGLKEKKLQNRIKLENLKPSTSEYLDQSQPANTKAAVKTAITALETVIKQVNPEEERKLEEMPEEDLAEYLEQFFKCVVKQDGSSYNASTLMTYFNSLARFFLDKKKVNIKTSEKFSRVSKVLVRRQEESMKEGQIPGKHAPKAIPMEVLVEAIAQGKFGHSDPKALTASVIKAFQAGFGIRNRSEMYNIFNSDVEVGPLKVNGVPEYIELGERITKMRRGKGGKGIIEQLMNIFVLNCVQERGSISQGSRVMMKSLKIVS